MDGAPSFPSPKPRLLEVRAPRGRTVQRADAIRWETGAGERIPTRVVRGSAPDRYRIESGAPLAPGSHRLVVAGLGGVEHTIRVTVVR